jgi:CubicO group peptidase (beta-lactamase class C family)
MNNYIKALAPEQTPTSDTPLAKTLELYKYFHMPENLVKIQFASPESHYAWQHLSEYYPTARVARGGAISELKVAIDESIGKINFKGRDGVERTVSQHFENLPLNAMLVMKDGKIVYERYKTMWPHTAHITMSCSKVISSTLLAMLEDEGKVDLSKPVTDYVPELKGSVWDTVLLRHCADMQIGLNATEHDEPSQDSRTNPDQPYYKWLSTIGLVPNTTGNDDAFVVMRTMERRKPGGKVFEYSSMNPFLLARIIEKIEDRPFADVFRDRIWSKIGAEHDATFVMTPQGYALAFGFTTITLRDFARFASIFTPSAKRVTGASILSADTVKRIQTAGNPAAYAGGYVGNMMTQKFSDDAGKISNAYMWDAIMSDGDMFKGGVGGQGLYVSPSRDMVAVWFTTGDGTEWNEAMGRAIALSFD